MLLISRCLQWTSFVAPIRTRRISSCCGLKGLVAKYFCVALEKDGQRFFSFKLACLQKLCSFFGQTMAALVRRLSWLQCSVTNKAVESRKVKTLARQFPKLISLRNAHPRPDAGYCQHKVSQVWACLVGKSTLYMFHITYLGKCRWKRLKSRHMSLSALEPSALFNF